jgi:mRNA interferase RelE/StbE
MGDFRIIYEIHAHQLVVLVIKVSHRRDVYERR